MVDVSSAILEARRAVRDVICYHKRGTYAVFRREPNDPSARDKSANERTKEGNRSPVSCSGDEVAIALVPFAARGDVRILNGRRRDSFQIRVDSAVF